MSLKIKKQPMTEERLYPILKSVHMIAILAECIKIEHRDRIFDTKFKQPGTNQAASKILDACNQLQRDLAFQFKVKDRDAMENNEAVTMWRILDHFVDIGGEKAAEFMDALDKMKEEEMLNEK